MLKQIQAFAGTNVDPSSFGKEPFNHWHFEKFLQRRELVPIRQAAAELSMDVPTFRKVVEAFSDSDCSVLVAPPNASDSFIHRSFLRDFHKGFESLRRFIFSSHDTYIEKLHAAIEEVLEVDVQTIEDPIDRRPLHKIDCLTGEPIALGNEVYLSTGKPIQLAPDCCSVYTYDDCKGILEGHLLGLPPSDDLLKKLRGRRDG